MSIALFFYMLAQMADIATTNRAIKKGGREANRIVSAIMGTLGFKWALAKFGIAACMAGVMVAQGSVVGLWCVAAVTGGIAVRNSRVV